MTTLNIGIAGIGTVGIGVFNILEEKKDIIFDRAGMCIEVVAVSSRNRGYDRGVNLAGVTWYDNAVDMASDDNIDVIVETIGGASGIAYDLCKTALSNGKSVVTANKALIAINGAELASIAEEQSVALLFEASVAGGIPILKSLREGLSANNFIKISGILNGTCNYILSTMKETGRSFDDVLNEAQELGYAETPPDLDIDGIDTAHKLAILTSIAYGYHVDFKAIYTEGIRNISISDIEYAKELGYEIKLLGIVNLFQNSHTVYGGGEGGGIEQRVHPCLVPLDSAIASVNGGLNAILAECDNLGNAFFTGAGAGRRPTASSVVADLIDIASGRKCNPFGVPVLKLQKGKFLSIDNHVGEYYVRIRVKDHAGVLASITSIFSEKNIGVEKVLQKAKEDTAQIALTTHRTSETAMRSAMENIGKKEYVLETPHMIRIEEF